jgi:hypothetical protein
MNIVLKPLGILLLLGTVVALGLIALAPRLTGSAAGTVALAADAQGQDAWIFSKLNDETSADTSVVRGGGPGGGPSLKLVVKKGDVKTPWHVQTYRHLKPPFKKGEAWELRFKARASEPNEINVVFELVREPFTKELAQPVTLTKEWKSYAFPFLIKTDYAAGDAKTGFQVGGKTGTYEFADVELVHTPGGIPVRGE